MAMQLIDGRTGGWHGLGEALDGMSDDGADQRFFGREVIVEGGDIDADIGGDLASAQALEAVGSDATVGSGDERAPSVRSPFPTSFINHLIDTLPVVGGPVNQLIDGL